SPCRSRASRVSWRSISMKRFASARNSRPDGAMTDLQLGLLVLGAAAVVGVVAYNRLQERAVRREAQRAFGSGHSDVLLDDARGDPAGRREPRLEQPDAARQRQLDAMPDER